MPSTPKTIMDTIAHLSALDPSRPATFEDLAAVHAARELIDGLFQTYADELASGETTSATWDAVAAALRDTGPSRRNILSDAAHDSSSRRVAEFWDAHENLFQWDFVPMWFLHSLYLHWMQRRHPRNTPVSPQAFTRRLKSHLCTSTGWRHVRSRPGSLMNAHEPLSNHVTTWSHDGSDDAIYGFRRAGV